MIVINVSEKYKLAEYYLSALRDSEIQRDMPYFRENVNRLSQILTWEFSKIIEYNDDLTCSPFANFKRVFPVSPIIMIAIVRAGLPIQQVASTLIPCEKTVLCSCEKDLDGIRRAVFSDKCNYDKKFLVLTESLMTSSSSLLCCLREVVKKGRPSNIAILNLISTPLAIENINKFEQEIAINTTLFTCAIDEFTPGVRGTIPGLGDVGDLLYGSKK